MANNLKTRRRFLLRCLLVMVLSLIPTMLLAQRGNVSLNLQNEEISRFIRQVEQQTNYTFVYRNNVLNSKTKVTLVCKNWPLEKALTHVFSPHGIQYSFNNNTIVLSLAPVARKEVESSEQKKAVAINEREQYTPEKHKISGVVLEAMVIQSSVRVSL